MADAADNGSSDWEVVSLTASTYAAAPGPISPPLLRLDAHKTESPLLPNPPTPSHFFMSQHFNLPKQPLITHLDNSGCQELESGPAVADGDAADAADFNTPCPENRESERNDVLVVSPATGNGLQVEGGGGDEVQQITTPCSLPDAAAGGHVPAADATRVAVGSASLPAPAARVAVGSASLPAPAARVAAPSSGVACNAAQAWWEKTFSFPRNNGTEPLAFRFVFVAGKLQLQEDLSPEFSVHSQTQKMGCAANEPLGQVKVSMLGGSPVSQQG